ncbi:MAG: hypothetical protein H6745_01045 [Deltaproteobacteria bacterium]|nr:hypothetical protein [Deltaproteobacteria bacterium]
MRIERPSLRMTAEAPIVALSATRSRVSPSTVALPAKTRSMVAVSKWTAVALTRPSVWRWLPVRARSTVDAATVLRVWT